jgi:hypothetical protein
MIMGNLVTVVVGGKAGPKELLSDEELSLSSLMAGPVCTK